MIVKICYDDSEYSDAGCWKFQDPTTWKWIPITSHDDPNQPPDIEDIMLRPGQWIDPTRDEVEVVK